MFFKAPVVAVPVPFRRHQHIRRFSNQRALPPPNDRAYVRPVKVQHHPEAMHRLSCTRCRLHMARVCEHFFVLGSLTGSSVYVLSWVLVVLIYNCIVARTTLCIYTYLYTRSRCAMGTGENFCGMSDGVSVTCMFGVVCVFLLCFSYVLWEESTMQPQLQAKIVMMASAVVCFLRTS